jgi:hypothetical protein
MMDFKLTQASSRRAVVWGLVAVIGIPAYWLGKDVTGLILLGTAVAAGLGVQKTDS